MDDTNLSVHFDIWNKLLLQLEIDLLLEPSKKESWLSAVAVLSDRIYERYRNQARPLLRSLLKSLEGLLKARSIPTRYQRALMKIDMICLGNRISRNLTNSGIDSGLSSAINVAIKETIAQKHFSTHATDLLLELTQWLEKRKSLEVSDLIDLLISLNVNHPLISDYIISTYHRSSQIKGNFNGLFEQEKYLIEKQKRIDYLSLRGGFGLTFGLPSLASQLTAYLNIESKWITRRIEQLQYTHMTEASNESTGTNTPKTIAKKFQTKWPAEKSDLIELAYALYVYMRSRGSKVTIVELANWLETAFGVSLARYSHRFAEIKMRKSTRPSKFLDALVEEFLNYVEEGDEFIQSAMA